MNCHRCGTAVDKLDMPWCDACYPVRYQPMPEVLRPPRISGYWISFGLINIFVWAGGLLGGLFSGLF